jgi:hypothetical protein
MVLTSLFFLSPLSSFFSSPYIQITLISEAATLALHARGELVPLLQQAGLSPKT